MEIVKRLSAIIIFLCLLVTALFGCAGTDDEAQPAAQSAAVSDEAPAGPLDHIETRDLGIVLNVLVEGDHMNRYASVEIMPSETNSDLLNENIEERNNLVEEKLGVTLNEIRTDATNNMQTLIRNDNISGTKLYDIVMPYFNDAAMLAPEGMFLNLYDYSDYIRFDAPYWDQRCIEDVSIAGKLYFATGDISLLTFDCTHCLIFNKDLLAESGITEDPYQLVLDGEWTIDKLHEMARAATSDSDGETGMTYEDTWGLFVNLNYATSLFVGSGERLSQKDEDDMPIITVNTERAITVMDKIVELYGDQASTIQIESFATEATGNGTDCWAEAKRSVDFYDVKGDVENLISPLQATFEAATHPAMHPGRCARVMINGKAVGFVGELHPKICRAYELAKPAVVFELEVDPLRELEVPSARAVSKFQPVHRDISVTVPNDVTCAQLQDAVARIRRTKPEAMIIESLHLFDVYRPEGAAEKSMAFRLTLSTLGAEAIGEKEADAAFAAVEQAFAELGATLRK